MPKLFQINICSAMLSTGKIAEDISKVAVRHGWETYTAWGRFAKPSVSTQIRIGNILNTYIHFVEHRLFDREGLASKTVTKRFIKQIGSIQPDIIHLHNIHDHYLNYPILFEYLAKTEIPVVWTQHDCWAFTGGCMYYDLFRCDKWKTKCEKCPEHRALLGDTTEMQFALKQKLLAGIKSLTYVSVSDWMGDALRNSHQKNRPIMTIHNGVDTSVFYPSCEKKKDGRLRILGVAAVWIARKGLADFIRLREILPSEYEITLVGLTERQINSLPMGITGVSRTTNVQELVDLYSTADVFVNPTYSDNFPTTNIESLACGTPVITYNTGGSPEAIDLTTGVVVEQGDICALANAIKKIKEHPFNPDDCRQRALSFFDKEKCFEKYFQLYNNLMS